MVRPSAKQVHAAFLSAAVLVLASSSPVSAQTVAPDASRFDGFCFTADEVAQRFQRAGYRVDSSGSMARFFVRDVVNHDAASARVAMVLVFADIDAAQTARLAAQAVQTPPIGGFTEDSGPGLVDGYGPSAWRHNVALVQTTRSVIERVHAAEHPLMVRSAASPSWWSAESVAIVDADFLDVLEDSPSELR